MRGRARALAGITVATDRGYRMETTIMNVDPNTARHNETLTALNKCIEVCIDGEKGYGAAAADVRDPTLKSVFQSYEKQRAQFVTDLQAMVGAGHENQGRLRGALHRGWTGVRMQLEGRNDDVIVDECMRGEIGALHAYDKILVDADGFLPEARAVLIHQRDLVASALTEMKNRLAFPKHAIETSSPSRTH